MCGVVAYFNKYFSTGWKLPEPCHASACDPRGHSATATHPQRRLPPNERKMWHYNDGGNLVIQLAAVNDLLQRGPGLVCGCSLMKFPWILSPGRTWPTWRRLVGPAWRPNISGVGAWKTIISRVSAWTSGISRAGAWRAGVSRVAAAVSTCPSCWNRQINTANIIIHYHSHRYHFYS